MRVFREADRSTDFKNGEGVMKREKSGGWSVGLQLEKVNG
jgi:hypothetical protein